MRVNVFIDKLLELMSNPIQRLEDSQERLYIQLSLQNDYIYNLINHFIKILPTYKYSWNLFQSQKIVSFTNIDTCYEYLALRDYLLTNNIFNNDEVLWLDDAIHEILVE